MAVEIDSEGQGPSSGLLALAWDSIDTRDIWGFPRIRGAFLEVPIMGIFLGCSVGAVFRETTIYGLRLSVFLQAHGKL